jgi:hypothetical protein
VLLSAGTQVSITNKTDHRDITEILLKVALNDITPPPEKNKKKAFHYYFCVSCLHFPYIMVEVEIDLQKFCHATI